MTSKGSAAKGDYTTKCIDAARLFPEAMVGFVATRALTDVPSETKPVQNEDFVVFTTGVNINTKGDKLGQQYQTPKQAVQRGADFIIAGRGIYAAVDRIEAAKKYQQEGWEAYLGRTASF
jgi:orotidine-5'-phosphate decarboxylase